MHPSRRSALSAVVVAAIATLANAAAAQTTGWTQVWNDEFDGATLDASKWSPETTNTPSNNEQQAYRPSQVTVSGGNMVIKSEKIATGGKPYVSGRVHSNFAQRHGRWEIRADLPTSRGMWPAIWLLPNTSQYNWPSQGEIDIMENRGTQPNLTSSAYHYGTNPPYFHDYRFSEQTTSRFGTPVNYHTGFHTYAVEWDANKLRFFVDDVNHWTLYNSDIDNYLSRQTAPMQVLLNTAIGGDFLGDQQPDASSVFPQQFLIDYVRVYQKNNDPIVFRNGDFEENGGSLAGWSEFGNRVSNNHNNVSVHNQAAHGDASLKLFGQFQGANNTSGVSQGNTVAAGDEVRAAAESFIRSQDSIAGTNNSVQMRIEFYSDFGGKRNSSTFLNEVTSTIANGSSAVNLWSPHELTAVAPAGAVEARLSLSFLQPGSAGGAVHIDNVSFLNTRFNPAADADEDGDVDGDDLSLWQQNYGAAANLAGDADADGDVDGADFLTWQQQLGAGAASPSGEETSAAAVPEPWSAAMAAAALVRLLSLPRAAAAPKSR
jgi:beta-glucanase (GH16 family)